ncbi:MAG TPA: hypothetical protein VI544_00295, partial [Candidatus Nanoarchaeia archaeon]|nr:hypothetical protein [Candidatus Nanoarchaeia archaeon]
VGVNSNSSVARYKPGRPINDELDRAELVASIRYVDYVVIFGEPDPREFLGRIKPDYHIKSKGGYTGIEKDVVESNGGQIILLDDLPGYSTSEILAKAAKSLLSEIKANGF